MIDIIAPFDAPQALTLPLGNIQHPLAPEVMQAVCRHGNRPVGLWKLINSLAHAREAKTRDHGRCLCLRYWRAVRELVKAGLLYRHDGFIAAKDFPITPKPKPARRLSASVVRSASKTGVSGKPQANAERAANVPQTPDREMIGEFDVARTANFQPKSAPPSAAEISAAASALARRPRGRKKWSGWIDGKTRSHRNMCVELPGGQQVYIYGVLRRKLVYTRELNGPVGDPDGAGSTWGVLPASAIKVVRNEHAITMGRMKAGKIERKSEAKARAPRSNGSRARHREH